MKHADVLIKITQASYEDPEISLKEYEKEMEQIAEQGGTSYVLKEKNLNLREKKYLYELGYTVYKTNVHVLEGVMLCDTISWEKLEKTEAWI